MKLHKLHPVFLEVSIRSKSSKPFPGDAVHLLSYKRDVAGINRQKLRDLSGEEWCSIARDNAGITRDQAKREALEAETGLLTVLRLKIGARAMCTSNVDVAGGLVNGTTGVVTKIYGKNVVQIRTEDLQYTARAQDDKKQMVKSGDNSHWYSLGR
jgi:hypothetical protein